MLMWVCVEREGGEALILLLLALPPRNLLLNPERGAARSRARGKGGLQVRYGTMAAAGCMAARTACCMAAQQHDAWRHDSMLHGSCGLHGGTTAFCMATADCMVHACIRRPHGWHCEPPAMPINLHATHTQTFRHPHKPPCNPRACIHHIMHPMQPRHTQTHSPCAHPPHARKTHLAPRAVPSTPSSSSPSSSSFRRCSMSASPLPFCAPADLKPSPPPPPPPPLPRPAPRPAPPCCPPPPLPSPGGPCTS